MGLQGIGYKLDIAFVIDATGSMTPIMDEVKQNALVLGDKICTAMKEAGKTVEFLRMRTIDFGDFATEGEDAIRVTDFLDMPAQKDKFEENVKNIDIDRRGGDIPENGLEALYVAMCSDWVHIARGEKGRHIIVLMTDAVPLHLGERDGSFGYNKDEYPPDFTELTKIWHASAQDATTQLHPANKRLVLFVPEGTDDQGHTWNAVRSWEKTTATTVDPDKGLGDIDLGVIIEEIVRSL